VPRQECIGGEWNSNDETNSSGFDLPAIAQSEALTTSSIPSGMDLAKENPSAWTIRSDEYRDQLVSDARRPLVSGKRMWPSKYPRLASYKLNPSLHIK